MYVRFEQDYTSEKNPAGTWEAGAVADLHSSVVAELVAAGVVTVLPGDPTTATTDSNTEAEVEAEVGELTVEVDVEAEATVELEAPF